MLSCWSNARGLWQKGTWQFGVILGLAYLGVFHLWTICTPIQVVASGCLVTAVLLGMGWRCLQSGYFLNKWDAFFHFCVILDILLEAILLPVHEGLGFYWCAAGFAVLIVGYRRWVVVFPRKFDSEKSG